MATVHASRKPAKFSCSIVSMTIEINDVRYSIDRTEAGEFGSKSYRLTKHSARDGGTYDVIRQHDGIVACDCPDYESRHRGNGYGMRKHGRAMVELGLLAAPIAPRVNRDPVTVDLPTPDVIGVIPDHNRNPVTVMDETPEACCDPAEPMPCQACVPAVEPAPDPTPEGDDDHERDEAEPWHAPFAVEPFEPSERDRVECAEMFSQMEAEAYLNRADRLTLAELVDHQESFYRAWANDCGNMLADAMVALALRIRMTESTTPAELEARSDALDLAARETWEAIGFDSARRECQCEDR